MIHKPFTRFYRTESVRDLRLQLVLGPYRKHRDAIGDMTGLSGIEGVASQIWPEIKVSLLWKCPANPDEAGIQPLSYYSPAG